MHIETSGNEMIEMNSPFDLISKSLQGKDKMNKLGLVIPIFLISLYQSLLHCFSFKKFIELEQAN